MKVILAYFLLLFPQVYKEKELILVPPGFTGNVTIIYKQKDGESKIYMGDRRAYIIPPCGILKTQFSEQFGWMRNETDLIKFVHYKNGNIIDTITYIPDFDAEPYIDSPISKIYAYCRI